MRGQYLWIIFFQTLLLWVTTTTTAQPQEKLDFVDFACLESENITTNSTYHNNILALLSNLHSLSSINKFSASSSGVGLDLVNGYYLCRPDLSLPTCRACISATIDSVHESCSGKKEAIIWYEECMIRYTNESISSANGTDPWTYVYSRLNVSQPESFPALVNDTMQGLISEAVSPNNDHPFSAFGEANFTTLEGLFGMVLCRPDITADECVDCLTTALDRIPTCCGGLSILTFVFQPDCQLWYDTAPFRSLQQSVSSLSLAPASPPPSP